MATKGAPKRAGRKVSDAEVKTTEHDELLAWLIDTWPSVAVEKWGPAAATLSRWHEEAKAEAGRWTDEIFRKLQMFIDEPERDLPYAEMMEGFTTVDLSLGPRETKAARAVAAEKTRETFSSALASRDAALGKLRKATQDHAIPTPSVKVVSCEVMRPIKPESSRQSLSFVDMTSRVERISGLRFAVGDCTMSDRVHHGYDPSLTQCAESLQADTIELRPRTEEIEVWCSVRSGSFTLGEVLQELKTLRDLGEKHETALVAEQVSPLIRSTLEREGFAVIERKGGAHKQT